MLGKRSPHITIFTRFIFYWSVLAFMDGFGRTAGKLSVCVLGI